MQFKEMFFKAKSGLLGLLRGGFFHILTGNFLNKAISMVSGIVIARLVDKSSYAYLSYADNIYSYIALATGLGLPNALLKFCSADNDKSLNLAYIKYTYKVGGAYELLASIGACIALTVLDIPYAGARAFAWALVLYPLLTLINNTNTIYMRTQLDNKKYSAVGVLHSLFICAFSIAFVVLMSTSGIVVARYIAVVLVLFYSCYYIVKNTKGAEKITLTKEQKKAFFSMGISLMLAAFFSGIMPINEAFLVNNLIRDDVTTANFRVAGLLPQMLLLVSGAITVYFFPIIARMKDPKEIKRKVVQIAVINAVIIGVVTIGGMVTTPFVINLLYGKKYMDAVPLSYSLWIMRGTNCIIRMVPINMLPAIGKTKFNVWSAAISCVVQCVVDYFLILKLGISGVTYGAIAVYFLSGIAYWIYFFSCCKEKPLNKES